MFVRRSGYFTAFTVALALLIDMWWPILLLAPVLPVVQQFIIVREEDYLKRRFGTDSPRALYTHDPP